MGIPLSGPSNSPVDCCDLDNGSPVGGVRPYVISLNGLQGILTIGADGGVSVRSEGGTIYIGANGTAGLGTVTSVNASSSNSNLTVVGGPVTTTGTFTFNLAGNLSSLSGLAVVANKLAYGSGANTFSLTDFTAYARTLLDDANAAAAQTTLGLLIGVNVQAFSQDLSDFATNASWTGPDLTLSGDITTSGSGSFNDLSIVAGIDMGGAITSATNGTFSGTVTAAAFVGNGSGLTNLDAADIASGTLISGRGGTGISSYAVGDLLYASGAGTLSKLADVAAGAFLRSGGVGTAPAWSSITLPNSLAIGDLLYASTAGIVSRLADVATGNALISGGVATAPSWGKITSSHTSGLAASGPNNDITSLQALTDILGPVDFSDNVTLSSGLKDSVGSLGTSGQVLSSNASSTIWSNQLSLSTLDLSGYLTLSGTITSIGTTGAVTINKPSGSANLAAAAVSLIVTNSLCTASSIVIATVASNDATCKSVQVVPTTGSFTIYPNAGPTATTSVRWILINPS